MIFFLTDWGVAGNSTRLAGVGCVLLVFLLGLPVPGAAQDDPGPTIPVSGQIGTNREALAALTRDSGNAGFGNLISQLIALEVATSPILSGSSGFVFLFDDVAEAQTSRSRTFGPLLLQHAFPSGHLATTIGLMTTTTRYDTVSDLSLSSLPVAFLRGSSPLVARSTLDLDVQAVTSTLYGRIGIGERLDIGATLPVTSVSIDGILTQIEQVAGTAVLSLSSSSVGLGDIGLLGKIRVWKSEDDRSGVAALLTVRAPTGDAEHLRGVDAWRTLVSGTATLGLGAVSVHASGGYEFWDKSIELSNELPNGVSEIFTLADQMQAGIGLEVAAHPSLSLSVDVVRREFVDSGRLEIRSFSAPVPALGIESADLLVAGRGVIQSLTVAASGRWSPAEYVVLSFGALMSPSGTGLRSTFTPVLGFSWTFCKEC